MRSGTLALVMLMVGTRLGAAEPPAEKPTASIVAVVGDQVILLDEVMGPVRGRLQAARAQLPPEKYREYEWQMLEQVTRKRIEQVVLLKELELFLPNKDILPRIRKLAAADFENYLTKMAKDSGLKSREEIIARIKTEGADLDSLRREFIDNLLSMQYLDKMVKPLIKEPTREELLAHYQAHQEEFTEPAGVIWRQIQVHYGADRAAARQKIQEAYDRLVGGQPFAKIAEEYSDGPTAASGGLWTLTSKGSYSDTAVDNVLFSIPLGQFSQIIEGKDSFQVVLVEKRNDGSPKPFPEVQGQIKARLMRDQRVALQTQKLDEILKKHHVETIFDQPDRQVASPGRSQGTIK